MGRDAGVTTQGPTQLSKKPIWTELPDQVPMDEADALAALLMSGGDHSFRMDCASVDMTRLAVGAGRRVRYWLRSDGAGGVASGRLPRRMKSF